MSILNSFSTIALKMGSRHPPPPTTTPPPPKTTSHHTLTWSGGEEFFWTRPKNCRGSPRGGFRGAEPPRTPEKFSKFFIKNPMKNYNFRAIFENFAILTKIFKNFSNFSRKCTDKSKLCSSTGFRGEQPHGRRRKFQNFLLKTNEKLQF